MSTSAINWDLGGVGGAGAPQLQDDDLQFFCDAIERLAGISLKLTKRDLVKTRLRPRLVATSSQDYREYRRLLEKLSINDPEWQQFINLLTTNKTDFFREAQHFAFLQQTIVPNWLKTSAETLTIWSAASSTGEEAYTLAMVLDECLPSGRSFKIVASDIDTEVLKVARNGVYPLQRLGEIPAIYHERCIDRGRGEVRDWFRIKPRLKERVSFGQHNLTDRELPRTGQFDLILCRNVLIYFSTDKIAQVCRKLFAMTKVDGHLFIGHSESFQGITHAWKAIGPSIYKRETG